MARPPFTFDRNTFGSNGSFLSRFITSPPFAGVHLKPQAILQHRFKKGQSAGRNAAHLGKDALRPAVDLRFVACCRWHRWHKGVVAHDVARWDGEIAWMS